MGCDIHITVEVFTEGKWISPEETPEELEYRNYSVFGWLADVRNYSHFPPIAKQRGIPKDLSLRYAAELERWEGNAHNCSWVLLSEILSVNLGQIVEDRRVGKQVTPNFYDGSWQAPEGEGNIITYREAIGNFVEACKNLTWLISDPNRIRLCFFFDS